MFWTCHVIEEVQYRSFSSLSFISLSGPHPRPMCSSHMIAAWQGVLARGHSQHCYDGHLLATKEHLLLQRRIERRCDEILLRKIDLYGIIGDNGVGQLAWIVGRWKHAACSCTSFIYEWIYMYTCISITLIWTCFWHGKCSWKIDCPEWTTRPCCTKTDRLFLLTHTVGIWYFGQIRTKVCQLFLQPEKNGIC